MILVTGGAGYIGSHCVLDFLNCGYEVVIFDNLETGHIEAVETLQKIGSVEFVKGDLKNVEDIENVFQNYNIDAVIHFAAYSLVGESVANPSKYYKNNILGSINLLDAMVKYNVDKIVFSSTCATYGEPVQIPIDEKHPQNPINPYGQSKLAVEKILNDYDKAYGIKSVKLRYFNVVGADKEGRIGEWHNPETHLVPNILKSAIDEDVTFKIFGDNYYTSDGTCVRDYVNVEDLASAHQLAYLFLAKENRSEVFNLGTEKGSSVKEIFAACENVLGKKIKVEIVEPREGDPAVLYADSRKAKDVLRWRPTKSLEESIQSAYNWEIKLSSKAVVVRS